MCDSTQDGYTSLALLLAVAVHKLLVTHASSRTATVKILQHLFATEVGVTITMAACGENVSVVKKGALWDNTSTFRRALKAK